MDSTNAIVRVLALAVWRIEVSEEDLSLDQKDRIVCFLQSEPWLRRISQRVGVSLSELAGRCCDGGGGGDLESVRRAYDEAFPISSSFYRPDCTVVTTSLMISASWTEGLTGKLYIFKCYRFYDRPLATKHRQKPYSTVHLSSEHFLFIYLFIM